MTVEEMEQGLAEASYDSEGKYIGRQFHRIVKPMHNRVDICALLVMESVAPGGIGTRAIPTIGYEMIYFDYDLEEVAAHITDEQIQILALCGVRIHEESFAMMV